MASRFWGCSTMGVGRHSLFAAGLAWISLSAGAAKAQDISPVFDMGALANTMSTGAVVKSECARAARLHQAVPRNLPWCDASPPSLGRAFSQPGPLAGPATPMGYSASAELRREAVDAVVQRVRARDAKNAELVQAELTRHDYRSIYDGIVRPYGLAGDDAAAALAAYLLLGWMIVHDGREPPAAAVRGVRAQAAAALSDPRLASAEARGRLGEEFKVLFVVLHAGWGSARREGSVERFAAGVADMFRKADGIDLVSTKLGPAGFERG
jgi:hypothetical protein